MSTGKMHVDEVDVDDSLVRRLLAAQLPEWAGLPIEPVHSAGTDNALYRLGDDMVVRLPRIEAATGQVDKEQQWLPRLAPHLPLAIPVPLAKGIAGKGYGMLDIGAVTTVWDAALQAPAWEGPPVWIHGDLSPLNLLVERGRIGAVIDFGCLGVGDPACDLQVAWNLLSAQTRDIFRAALAVDDAMWARGRGWALSVGLIALPYYQSTNPLLAGIARHAIDEVLADQKHAA